MKKSVSIPTLCALCVIAFNAAWGGGAAITHKVADGKGSFQAVLANGATANTAAGDTAALPPGVAEHTFIVKNASGQVTITPMLGFYVYDGDTISRIEWIELSNLIDPPPTARQYRVDEMPADVAGYKAEHCDGCNFEVYYKSSAAPAWAYLFAASSASSDFYAIAVDLDGTTAFPHTYTNNWAARDFNVELCLDAAGEWAGRAGLIYENDATDGSVWWFYEFRIVTTGAGCNTYPKPLSPGGSYISGALNGQTPTGYGGTYKTVDSANWDNDDHQITFMGQAKLPSAGDMVFELDEVSGSATCKYEIGFYYTSE